MPSHHCDTEIDDIEDIVGLFDLTPNDRYESRKQVVPKARKRREDPIECQSGKKDVDNIPMVARDRFADSHISSIIPGRQTIWVRTWGCTHNNSDGEYMAGQLASYGYTITDHKDSADLWLLNSCTVKSPAEDHFRNAITEANKKQKHVVVAGCVPQAAPRVSYMKGLSIVGVQQIDRVVEVVEETLKGNSVRLLGQKKQDGKKSGGARLDLPKIRRNPLIEILAVNTGCLNQCTYCKTKHARGDLGSYPIDDLVARAKESFDEGVCEIWLTSEDTGAYGKDIGLTLPNLLWKLVETIPEGAMMRIGMTNPPYILEHLEEMAAVLNHPRVYAFLHVPVQSASDSVLMDMKREYCRDDFCRIVDFLRERVPGITIATDVICGFPTETEEDFKETMDLVSQYRFPSLFINQFFPRPGTPASKMRQVPAQEIKKRTKAISELFQSYRPYDHKVGEKQRILVTEVAFDKKNFVGHNKFYEQVIVPGDERLMGRMLDVEIVTVGKHYLSGRVLRDAGRPAVAASLIKGRVSGLKVLKKEDQPSVQSNGQVRQCADDRSSSKLHVLQISVLVLVLALLARVILRYLSSR